MFIDVQIIVAGALLDVVDAERAGEGPVSGILVALAAGRLFGDIILG